MFRKYSLFILTLFVASSIFGQSNLLNAKEVDMIGVKSAQQLASDIDEPLPYDYVSDRDVLWSKVVWEYIDLNQKINLPYYFPISSENISPTRRSLFDTLITAIREGEILSFYEDSFFKTKQTYEELEGKLIDNRDDGYGGTDPYEIKAEKIAGYMIKGIWYFDKRHGELKYRLLALAPMGPDVQTIGTSAEEEGEVYPLFWLFYPEVRNLLYKSEVFNSKNNSNRLSYDHLLNARRFSAVIVREENLYGNRTIKEYVKGNSLFQLLEAARIKEEIRNKEMDMWNY